MAHYDVVQRLAAVATTYDVKDGDTALVARGAFTSVTPRFTLVDEKDKELGTLAGNFNKTEFHIKDAAGKEVALVTFPSIALKKTLELEIGGKKYHADAGLLARVWDFKCADAAGKVAVEVKKPEGFTKVRDRFLVEAAEDVSREIAVLLTVAIHSRYFEMI